MMVSVLVMMTATFAGVESNPVDKTPDVEIRAIEAEIVAYTNEQRKRYGLEPLEVDPLLLKSARKHTQWMTNTRQLVHGGGVAENIAMGQPDTKGAIRAWMNSSGHRANILNPRYRRIGVASFKTSGGTSYWCQQFK